MGVFSGPCSTAWHTPRADHGSPQAGQPLSTADLRASSHSATTRDGNTKSHLEVSDLPAGDASWLLFGGRACLERGHPPQCVRLSSPHTVERPLGLLRDPLLQGREEPCADHARSSPCSPSSPPWAPSWNWPPANSAVHQVLQNLSFPAWLISLGMFSRPGPPHSPHWNFIPVHGE